MKIRLTTFELLHADRQADKGKANTWSFYNFWLRTSQKKKKNPPQNFYNLYFV